MTWYGGLFSCAMLPPVLDADALCPWLALIWKCCQQLPHDPLPVCGLPCPLTLMHPEAFELTHPVRPILLSLAVKSPVMLAVAIEISWSCTASSSVATEEMPSHNHMGTASTSSLTGHFSSNFGTDQSPSFSGIIKSATHTGSWRGKADSDSNKLNGFNIDASHSHVLSINNTGSNIKHENRMPYEVVHRWKRTA